ncbi:PTS transporter subunit EIIC, partial [Klebsiella quasipneumoniae]
FLAYMRDPSISPLMNEALRFSQQGMVTIFGLPGAALAFYHTAKPEKKMLAKAILIPAITTSILVGITEPIEFTFL